jgi:hypothetical protein
MRSAIRGYGGGERAVELVTNGAVEISRRMGYRPPAAATATIRDGDYSDVGNRQVS